MTAPVLLVLGLLATAVLFGPIATVVCVVLTALVSLAADLHKRYRG